MEKNSRNFSMLFTRALLQSFGECNLKQKQVSENHRATEMYDMKDLHDEWILVASETDDKTTEKRCDAEELWWSNLQKSATRERIMERVSQD